MLPDIVILVVTYQRADVLRDTLNALMYRLQYEGDYSFVIADDGSIDGTQAVVEKFGRATLVPFELVQSVRVGLGANTNAGLRRAFELSPFVLQLQDDMQIQQGLDITPHVKRLIDYPQDGFIRLWGIGGHKYTATLDEGYWRIHWTSNDLYIPSDRPHLKHKRFHEAYGLYPEGLPTAHTEDAWCHQVKDRALAYGGPSVLVPHSMEYENGWEHMGYHDSWRFKGL